VRWLVYREQGTTIRVRLRTRLGLGLVVTTAIALSANHALAMPGAEAASAGCSKMTAGQVVEQNRLNHFDLPNPVRQVLCGPFTGPGSQAMAITIGAPTCWGIQHWAVFTFAGGAWRLVLDQPAYLMPPLAAVGSGIRETTAVHRAGDSRCFPSGGTRARTWRWNGSRLVAGPWKQVTPADTYENGALKTPSANIVCDYFIHIGSRAPDSTIGCVIRSGLRPAPPRRPCQDGGYAGDRVYLGVTGRVEVPACAGDPGPYVSVDRARVLGYGKTWSGGGFRCTSAEAGLTCRNKSGHGFFLSRERWRAF
jgi:hypothetical protein